MARKFFYVCAGLFLLALSFHLGATSARGQAAGTEWFISGDGTNCYVTTASGDVWRYVPSVGWLGDGGNIFGGASGGQTIVGMLSGQAVTSTGEVWFQNGHNPWTNAGAPPFGAVPVVRQSWGGLKQRYR